MHKMGGAYDKRLPSMVPVLDMEIERKKCRIKPDLTFYFR